MLVHTINIVTDTLKKRERIWKTFRGSTYGDFL